MNDAIKKNVFETARSRVTEPGVGLGNDGWRVLTYSQLRRATPGLSNLPVTRTIELHLTGNMERYMWSFDGEQYHSDMPDIVLPRACKQGSAPNRVRPN
jgi:FtsP/CotA-like multicopper oxidase with cupredoxin domain